MKEVSAKIRRIKRRLDSVKDATNDIAISSDKDIIRYIAAMFASLSVAYISVGVIQHIFDQPHGIVELFFGVQHQVQFLTVAYGLVIGMFLGLFGCAILRFLDD